LLEFNDLLRKAEVDLDDVLVMRQRPYEPQLRRVFAWIEGDRPDLFAAYQASQFSRAEKALSRARFLASFIGLSSRRALFVALYDVKSARKITREAFWAMPENRELQQLGMTGFTAEDTRSEVLWFDLGADDVSEPYSGRLEIEWPGGERSWFRWACRYGEQILLEVVLDTPEKTTVTLQALELADGSIAKTADDIGTDYGPHKLFRSSVEGFLNKTPCDC